MGMGLFLAPKRFIFLIAKSLFSSQSSSMSVGIPLSLKVDLSGA